jgi:integrase
MASILERGGGRRAIQFVTADGRRKTISLGKMSRRMALEIKVKVEDLEASARAGLSPAAATATWLAGAGRLLHDKLTRAGLTAPRAEGPPLGQFLDDYRKGRTDVAPATTATYTRAARLMVAFFGEDRLLGSITPGDADRFAEHLRTTGAQATASKTISQARQFYRRAVRLNLVSINPFGDVKGGTQMNPVRNVFIDATMTMKVLEACPDGSWRLLVALCRYGGLRHPSETLGLRWSDVLWDRDRMTVTSPKTRRQGKPARVVPIFVELRPYLEAAFDEAPEAAEFVLNWQRGETSTRNEFERIIRQAGYLPWTRLWQNLRASRATELASSGRYGIKTVTSWMGHTVTVAMDHYLSVPEEDFARAARCAGAAETAGNSENVVN